MPSPRDESEIETVLSWCEAEGAAVVPFGGGTSVVGGVEARLGERPFVSLDLRRLDRVLEVDAESMAARIQAGATGPRLEEQLREHGLTLRHFPQSFEYSTLGGWIATRAGGHFATLYTHIDDLVESVRAITPRGTWESRRLPGSGAGPSPDRALIGSEGILGVIAEAWVRVRPRPGFKASCGVEFDDFLDGGAGGSRDLPVRAVPGQLPPARRAGGGHDRGRHRREEPACARLRVGPPSVEAPMELALEIAREHGGAPGEVEGRRRRPRTDAEAGAEQSPVEPWRSAFLLRPLPARHVRRLRGALGDLRDGDHLGPLRGFPRERDGGGAAQGRRGLRRPVDGPGAPRVSCRFTHVYPDGPAPYFTVMAPAVRGGEVEQWDEIKAAASEAVIEGGGTITHHHAVGRDHRPWYDRQRPAPFAAALRAAKAELDPAGILNPGVLIDP